MVERLLAKEKVAGSIPVSRSIKIADTRRVSAIFFEPNPGLKGFVLASGSVGSQTGVHWTPLTPVLRSIFLSGNQAVMLVSGHLYFVEFESA